MNQHEAGIRSTNNPEPNARSSPGNTTGNGAADAHRPNPGARPGGAVPPADLRIPAGTAPLRLLLLRERHIHIRALTHAPNATAVHEPRHHRNDV